MKERGLTKVTRTFLIDVFVKGNDLESALRVYTSMKRDGLEPETNTYSAMIHGLCAEGIMKDAHKLFDEMLEKGLKPNNMVYDTMICDYCREGNSHRVQNMVARGDDKKWVGTKCC